jgi:tetratricopeptide (TPR) repeat protein
MDTSRLVRSSARSLAVAVLTCGVLSAQPATLEPTPAVRSPGNAQWASSADEARTRAASEGKNVFYEISQPRCGNCIRMDTLLYPAFDFEALLISMVPVKVSLDSPEGRELARRYNIQEAPAVVVTTPTGRLIFQMVGFTNTQDFYPHILRDLDAYRQFVRKIEAQDIARLKAREALDTATELYERSDPAAALPRLRRAVSAPDVSPTIRDEARELLAAVELDLGQVGASRATTERLIETTRDSLRRQRAEIFRAQLPLAENKPAEAVAIFKKFLRDHPNSPYRKQVSDMLERLAGSPPRR